jgi:ABC-type Fe3+-hydroxamate transport system substrate-binding protein
MGHRHYLDQLSRSISLQQAPLRIVSLVPSQTELLFDLGLENEVVGITKFCIHPKQWFDAKTRVGGTKDVDVERIRLLRPDLIIANKEENTKGQIDVLAAEFPVWVSDVHNLSSALEMTQALADITETHQKGMQLCQTIAQGFEALLPIAQKTVVYLIWHGPYMAAGSDTFINDMLSRCGLVNCIAERRYPTLTEDALAHLAPEVILLSSEPFPFSEKHVAALQVRHPTSKIMLVDGELFSWYGSRLLAAPSYFKQIQQQLKG